MSPGQTFSIKVKEIIHTQKTKFQDLEIFQSENHGKVLVLDGMIQLTENDEFSYQEMITHLPMFSHPNPENVLIIGGGDGGVAREVLKHNKSLKKLILVDIDEGVIECSKKYLPKISNGAFENPKMTTKIMDGFQFLKDNKNSFDVIITDSSDPVGPACSLFQKEFYTLMKDSLTENGVVCCQGECLWLHLDLIEDVLKFSNSLYGNVGYGFTTIPTYPSGQIGFILCSKGPKNLVNFENPNRKINSEISQQNFDLRYYNENVHRAAFVLPEFARKRLERIIKKN